MLGKSHPRPAFLVEKLKNYELQLRLDATTKFKDGDSQNKKTSHKKKMRTNSSYSFQKFLHRINYVHEDLKKKPSSLSEVPGSTWASPAGFCFNQTNNLLRHAFYIIYYQH